MPAWDDLNATRISPIVAYAGNDSDGITLWHWCAKSSDWTPTPVAPAGVTASTPLTLADPSAWACCGLRGHIRAGHWTPA